ncbi:sigma-70 family RNA polymerase sigma factor [Paenibacillus sp. L3-i20]|uniref:sigma-70 family RNA polymerase sigma factor n=1 Tax=Paenibacillus sp. L3-i20 TaxID=2905833 RepID=UPI001EDE399A|nr:sigma-70 family RNA polymerase sigma factor [Paenibacillus sp. L3-i20]GKU78545.1 DNA-directed RNA polymerase sigma-70 factor [Paenibacillus sp. L3-i20]
MNETELVKKAIAGDVESFSELIVSRRERLYRIAYTYVRNKEDALEIVQETVYRAMISVQTVREPKYFNTWLTKIAVNNALDYIRKAKKTVYIDNDYEAGYVPERTEEHIDLHKALDTLDEKAKTIIVLRYFEDLSLNDISDIVGSPLSTVKSIIYRSLAKLNIELKDGDDDE